MSDVWEVAYGVTDSDPGDDLDGDGQDNLSESVSGTDPLDAGSAFRITDVRQVQSAYVARWNSVVGRQYQLESAQDMGAGLWLSQGPVIEGTGGIVTAFATEAGLPITGLRLRLLVGNRAVTNARPQLAGVDTDLDDSPDIDEWAAGTDPFDGRSHLSIDELTTGDAAVLTWDSVRGKVYQVESAPDVLAASWVPEGELIPGRDAPISCVVEADGDRRWFRLAAADVDSDLDGVTDWEEALAGEAFRPWHYRTNFPTDPATISTMLAASNVINIEPSAPVANISRDIPGAFKVTRTGNLDRLTVHYAVGGSAQSGTHYQPLTGTVTLQPGEHEAEIPVVPLSAIGLLPTRSVTATLLPSESYGLGTNQTAQVNILREVAISVADYGAVGDGFTDDTLPIQAAIDALEASTSHNTLHFPAGTYRLNTRTWKTSPTYNWYQLLELGKTDLAGRDILFTGAGGAELYSTTSPIRCHILVTQAKFRSLRFHDLGWRKDGNPLTATTVEPNNADGVRVTYYDQRRVEEVGFFDCTFVNCHRAVTTSFNVGYDTRGRLARFNVLRCKVLNPYGSNTIEGQNAFGGGQQVAVGPWIGEARYADCLFDGGTNGAPDLVRNPGGIRKDGSHFGGPLRLIFTNNIVTRMAVEAVYQTDESHMASTAGPITFPPSDGVTPAEVLLYPAVSTFIPGQILNIRTPLTPGNVSGNGLVEVVSYDAETRILTVVNPGLTPGIEGTTVQPSRPIYLQDYNPTEALIADNHITAETLKGLIGVASNSRALITHNFIEGFSEAIRLYENGRNPLNPPTPGTLLNSNVILTKSTAGGGLAAYGVRSWGPGEIIDGNLIVAPSSYRFVGTSVHGTNAWVEANTVIPMDVVRNGYDSATRAVGIGFGNGSSNNTAAANSTYGMDVGNGPENAFQPAFRRVISHHSTNDVLAVDPIALVP